MGKTVTFKYNVDDKVVTPFGEKGIVNMCGIDDSGVNKCYVKTSKTGTWFKEGELKPV